MEVFSIPDKVKVTWNEEVKAMVDYWDSYDVTLEEFREAILDKGLNFAKSHKANAWIVDSSQAKGVLGQDIQHYIETDVLPSFGRSGIKYFITISSEVSALTNLTIRSFSLKTGPNGIKLIELNSVKDGIEWLKVNG